MTREEAIKILKAIRVYECYPKSASEETKEAIDMAIEALKENNRSDSLIRDDAENCKESESKLDLIRRSDALDALGEEPMVWYDGEDEIAERNQWRRDKAALESLPSATCDDCIWHVCNYNKIDWDGEDGYISRRDTLDKAILVPIAKVVTEDKVIYRRVVFVEDIESLPSVEPKTGKWIRNDDYICDQCGYHMIVGGGAYNYCPNCGARMTKGGEE